MFTAYAKAHRKVLEAVEDTLSSIAKRVQNELVVTVVEGSKEGPENVPYWSLMRGGDWEGAPDGYWHWEKGLQVQNTAAGYTSPGGLPCVTISGATGNNAGIINGEYFEYDELQNGNKAYRKDDAHGLTWLAVDRNGRWCVRSPVKDEFGEYLRDELGGKVFKTWCCTRNVCVYFTECFRFSKNVEPEHTIAISDVLKELRSASDWSPPEECNARCRRKHPCKLGPTRAAWGACCENGDQKARKTRHNLCTSRCPECTVCAHAVDCACQSCVVSAIDLLENPTAGSPEGSSTVQQRLRERQHLVETFKKDVLKRQKIITARLEDMRLSLQSKMLGAGRDSFVRNKSADYQEFMVLVCACV